ncbi:L30e-like protein [Pseudovirgaria hyperparasitica]|uniref:H/ACA ribonucleoprotein complex subunit 2 n=1 Tax=Pseudovirgaria hyperparasitica TaxID=470096 RepID=A0A6A6WJT6_9PEZI|nr:L30e-like protein [Pseudovirgaria hyperparasitica]KAF2762540.1 L30e-like protein [Pseudovirgaria hyperparasitica]
MSKEKSSSSKKERKEKVDDSGRVKKEKKDKKEKKAKKEKLGAAVTDSLIEELEAKKAAEPKLVVTKTQNNDGSDMEELEVNEDGTLINVPAVALVPFANPLADEKQTKKVMKGVKKAAKHKSIRRGVKEVVKSLRKTTSSGPASSANSSPASIVVIAADISPMDVISHIPVLCEDHNIPYIYVKSRAELGAAGSTKRPTSVVMLTEKSTSKKGGDGDESEWKETYGDLVKVLLKAQASVKI